MSPQPISRPSATPAQAPRFSVAAWKPYAKNTMQAWLTIVTAGGMEIAGCSYHVKGSSRWLAFPSQKYVKPDGTASYTPIITFATDEARQKFQRLAIDAIDRHLGGRQ